MLVYRSKAELPNHNLHNVTMVHILRNSTQRFLSFTYKLALKSTITIAHYKAPQIACKLKEPIFLCSVDVMYKVPARSH